MLLKGLFLLFLLYLVLRAAGNLMRAIQGGGRPEQVPPPPRPYRGTRPHASPPPVRRTARRDDRDIEDARWVDVE